MEAWNKLHPGGLVNRAGHRPGRPVAVLIFLAGLILAASLSFPVNQAAAAESRRVEAGTGDVFELRYRQLQPGEPLLVIWTRSASDYAGIFFGESSHWLKKGNPGPQFLVLGLDVMLKPGERVLEVEPVVWRPAGGKAGREPGGGQPGFSQEKINRRPEVCHPAPGGPGQDKRESGCWPWFTAPAVRTGWPKARS